MRYASSVPMPASEVHEPRRKFTRDEVDRMLALGILADEPGVELLEGDLVVMSPQGSAHSGLTEIIRARLEAATAPRLHARTHAPVDAGPHSQPEPDIALVLGARETYLSRHPAAADTLLVVEVARSSLPRDRKKAFIYAGASFREYWLFDLESRTVEVHSDPDDQGRYRMHRIASERDSLAIPDSDSVLELAPLFALL
jgi:Uma2 family endonuclease